MTIRRFILSNIVQAIQSAALIILEQPKLPSMVLQGQAITWKPARLSETKTPIATRILVAGTLVASGITAASYTPTSSDVIKTVSIEVDYQGTDAILTAKAWPEVVFNDEWMTPTPVVRDTGIALTSPTQPGTRLLYVANSGAASNRTDVGRYYFWNGSAIIDSAGNTTNPSTSQSYGTDPLNPGPGIVPWGKYAAVAQTYAGQEVGVRGNQGGWEYGFGPTSYGNNGRKTYPDWILFKRGETFDLTADAAAYQVEVAALGTTNTMSLSKVTSYGGLSWASRQVFSSYGPTTTNRAVLKNPAGAFASRYGNWSNVQYLDLVFDGTGTPNTSKMPYGFTCNGTDGVDLWFVSCRFIQTPNYTNASATQHFRVHRCNIAKVYSAGDDVSGLFCGGGPTAKNQVTESFFSRNGYNLSPSYIEDNWNSFPAHNQANAYSRFDVVKYTDNKLYYASSNIPSGTAFVIGYNSLPNSWVICGVNNKSVGPLLSRSNYWGGESIVAETIFRDNIVLRGASGEQVSRSGCRTENNYVYAGYLGQGAHGGYPDSYGATGVMDDNVLFRYDDTTSGNPAWGLGLTMGSAWVSVRRNIISNALLTQSGGYGLELKAVSWETSGYYFTQKCRNNYAEGNYFETAGVTPITVEDGLHFSNLATHPAYGSGPGLLNNSVKNNVFVTTAASDYVYTADASGYAPVTDQTQTQLSGNTRFTTRALLATAKGGVNADRSHKTLLQSKGVTVTTQDAVSEFEAVWENMSRGNWDVDYTAKGLNNYVRAGWGMPTLV